MAHDSIRYHAAMASITVSIDIAASPEVVFDTAVDLSNWPEVIDDILSIEILTNGPVGVGTVFRETRTMFGKEATEEMTFESIERPHGYVLTAHSCGNHYVTTSRIEPIATGTRLHVEFKSRPEKLLAWLFIPMGWMFKGMIRKCLQKDLTCMKAWIESRA